MMQQKLIFLPLLFQVLLTVLVWLMMYKTRITEIKTKKINPQLLNTTHNSAKLLKAVSGPSENFTNLFEVPSLFYIAIITIYITQLTDTLLLTLCSLFVFLRYLHSFIHSTYNNVMHRFYAYISSTIILWITWAFISIKLFSH